MRALGGVGGVALAAVAGGGLPFIHSANSGNDFSNDSSPPFPSGALTRNLDRPFTGNGVAVSDDWARSGFGAGVEATDSVRSALGSLGAALLAGVDAPDKLDRCRFGGAVLTGEGASWSSSWYGL